MTLSLWRDNRLPSLTDTITADGSAVNLTGSTVTFSMRRADSAALKVSAASATIVSAAAGTVSYAWAADDVDTVGGDETTPGYYGWWTVTTTAKTQDTPEFGISILEHAPDSVAVVNPVGAGGATTIYQGDAYLDTVGRALTYQLQVQDGPDLTGLVVTYRIEAHLEKAMTVVGEDAVKIDLTSAETTALPVGTHQMEIEATVSSGNVVTLLRSFITVLDDMEGP